MVSTFQSFAQISDGGWGRRGGGDRHENSRENGQGARGKKGPGTDAYQLQFQEEEGVRKGGKGKGRKRGHSEDLAKERRRGSGWVWVRWVCVMGSHRSVARADGWADGRTEAGGACLDRASVRGDADLCGSALQ